MTQSGAERNEGREPDGGRDDSPVTPATARPRRRRWYQFSLWTLFALTVLAALALMGWRWTVAPYLAQADTMALVERLGGSYRSEPAPKWMSRLAGQELGDATLVNLADCDQPDEYIAEVARLPRLEILVVGGQAFGDDEVAQLSGTKSLRWLILDSTNVSGEALAAVQEANPELQVYRSERRTIAAIKAAGGALEVRKNDDYRDLHSLIGAEFFDEPQQVDAIATSTMLVARVTSLRQITLYGGVFGGISEPELTAIARMPNVESLALDAVADDGLRLLGGMTKLRSLSLVGCSISDAGLSHLTEMQDLATLTLGSTKITDAGLAHIGRLTNLQVLAAERTMITDAGIAHLAGLKKLRWLRVPGTKVGDAGLAHLANHKEMEYLFPGEVTDAGLQHLAGMSKLKHLVIGGPGVTDKGLESLKVLPNLEELSLSGAAITDAGLSHLATLTGLQRLNLLGTPVTDAAVEHLAKLTSLRELDVRWTRVSQEGAARIQKALPGCKLSSGIPPPWKVKPAKTGKGK